MESSKQIGLECDMKPRKAKVEYAEKIKACFIFTGTRGMVKFRRTVMGSVRDYIVHYSPFPVLACPLKNQKEHKENEKEMSVLATTNVSVFSYKNFIM